MIKHYLLTIPLAGSNLHGYLMTNDKRHVAAVLEKMVGEVIPKTGDRMALPMVLQTELGDAAGRVRDVIMADPQARECLLAARDFHFSAFSAPDPDIDRALMELH
ncbi:hypothetical protein [Reyranella soli]|uniref:Uncharacterized protein n=1 Tax=Reyranella soli TaxID=1230389 RepID=A0A512NKL2_9HYPH|nr:hypothetical protein [Reyranella soli]GEP59462.1 hypothetical protein RSO01_66280 [Reyranella soli]